MLEKMGWKEGKGLGANEDGTTEHIKVKKKIDNQGIGTETVTHNKNWLETSVAYESILASLNASYGTKPDTTGTNHQRLRIICICFISAINF
jgi:Pin2-interacting protein X1